MEVVVTMRDLIYLIVCLQVIKIATCIYFHESSYVTLVAAGKTVGDSDFGYSLGYQGGEKSNLVIGAPNGDRYGRVYMCSLKEPFISNTSYCPEVDMDFEKLTPDTRTEQNPDQRFMLGTSIAATPQYFLASAPLWTGALNKITVAEPYYFVYGSCFVYANDTSHRYKGLYEEAQSKIIKETQTIAGGIGWKTLVDEVHKLILISKPSTPPFKGTILRLNIEKPLEATKTLLFEDLQAIIKLNLRYFGTSIASGKFFNTSEQIYAVSMRNIEMYGKILFLNYNSKNQRLAIMKLKKRLVTIQDSEVGTMFGAALYGADLNKDGLSELLVGAPAHSEDRTGYDTGAVHIYLGGPQESIKNYSRKRTVLGNIDGSRFGSTIAANDLDGDGIPEIFVSAPYENSGNGALYIIAGYEIYNDLIKADCFKQIPLSKLNLTQRIQNEHFKFFGHSIQVLPDLDNNGCDEMVVGAPNTNNVMLLRCIPQIRVTITSELVGTKIIREQDNDFTIKVCVNVTYYSRMDKINTHLLVSNNIIGVEAFLDRKHRIYTIDLVQKKEQYCENVVVKLNNNEQDVYRFYAKVSMDEKDLWNIKEFNKNWVTISPDSKLEAKVLEIFRYCTGDDCLPLLSTSFSWSGSTTYVVESAQNECITVRVHNGGHSSYKACVWIHLTGAQVAQIDCANREGGYLCYLPNPLNRNADHAINMTLNMRTLTSMTKHINASIRLFEDCPEPFEVNVDQSKFKTANTSITLLFKMEDISLRGSFHNVTITDKEILDKKKEIFNATHEYVVVNNGYVTWENVEAILTVDKVSHINITGFRTSSTESTNCKQTDVMNGIINCKFTLAPNSSVTLLATVPVFNHKIIENLVHNTVRISTNLSLILYPTATAIEKGSTTTIIFQKELSLAQDKTAIIFGAVILAALILMAIAYLLYKIGFFKRKQKEELRDHIRRKSFKQSTSGPHDNEPEEIPDLNIELKDDAFEPQEVTADNVPLHQVGPKTESEVHS